MFGPKLYCACARKFYFELPVKIRTRPSDSATLTMVRTTDILAINAKKTYKFATQCKGEISHAFKTAKITVFDPMMCKSPDVPLQDELCLSLIHI